MLYAKLLYDISALTAFQQNAQISTEATTIFVLIPSLQKCPASGYTIENKE